MAGRLVELECIMGSKMTYFVYVLKSAKDGTRYTGITTNLIRRLADHNKGCSRYTKIHRPYQIVYFEESPNRIEARKREKYLKTGFGRQFIDNFINIPL